MKVLTKAQAITFFGVRKDEEWLIRLAEYMNFLKNRNFDCDFVTERRFRCFEMLFVEVRVVLESVDL